MHGTRMTARSTTWHTGPFTLISAQMHSSTHAQQHSHTHTHTGFLEHCSVHQLLCPSMLLCPHLQQCEIDMNGQTRFASTETRPYEKASWCKSEDTERHRGTQGDVEKTGENEAARPGSRHTAQHERLVVATSRRTSQSARVQSLITP